MKAILIDAGAQEVREIEIQPDENGCTLSAIYAAIGCELIDVVRITRTDAIFVDDVGLLRAENEFMPFFLWDGYPNPLAGNGLILGSDENGNSAEPTVTHEWVRKRVEFLDYDDVVCPYHKRDCA